MLEKRIEKHLGQLLHQRGALFYKFVSPGRPGVPDRIAVLPGGRVVFVELKADAGRVSKLQAYELDRLRRHGAEAYVVYGAEGVERFVEYLFRPAHTAGGKATEGGDA